MDDVWLCVDEDSNSSHDSTYSDNIDSEIEAELYGMIHHQENLSHINNHNEENSSNVVTPVTFSPVNNQIDLSRKNIANVKFSDIRSDKSASNTLNLINPKEILYSIDQNSSEENVHKISRPLKHKSDSEQNSYSVILYPKNTERKNSINLSTSTLISKKNCSNSSKKKSFSNRNKTIEVSSDSDDSVIWTEPNSSFKNDLKTNLFNDGETISINCSSFAESVEDISPPLRRKELNLKNISLPNIKLGENYNDVWHINDEDLYRSKKKSRRYHENIDSTQCSNCGKKGHFAKSCPVPKGIKCFYCGGAHVGAHCRNKICSKCYNTGHDSKFCQMKNTSDCFHCNMKGHFEKDCPDIWRRYHLTTDPVKIVAGKPVNQDRNIYCFNCGWPGHFGAECKEPRNVKGTFPTWPCVISYSNPDELLAKRLGKKSTNCSFGNKDHDSRSQQNFIPKRMNVNHNQQFRFCEDSARRNYNQSHNFNTVHDFITERRRENQNLQVNGLQDTTAERKDTNKERKLKKWEFFKQRQIERNRQKQAALKEKDFPRTPKKTEINQEFTDAMPERITFKTVSEQIKKRMKKRKWQIFQQKKKLRGGNIQKEDM